MTTIQKDSLTRQVILELVQKEMDLEGKDSIEVTSIINVYQEDNSLRGKTIKQALSEAESALF